MLLDGTAATKWLTFTLPCSNPKKLFWGPGPCTLTPKNGHFRAVTCEVLVGAMFILDRREMGVSKNRDLKMDGL